MPRARPAARKSEARRRIYRYRTKWTHQVIPERLKRLLWEPPHVIWDEYADKVPPAVECEEPTMTELQTKGVPESEWPYYLGYMKRMLAFYQQYSGATLTLEKTNLIEEYVLRGKDRDVLEQVQEVAAECAGIAPPEPPEEKLMLQHVEPWNLGPPSVLPLQHAEPWTLKEQPTFTLQHSEAWSS